MASAQDVLQVDDEADARLDSDLGAGLGGAPLRPGSDATLERLREKILSGELPPGSVVSQTKLARDLGISTTPLREVIRQLQAEGLLEVELNRRPRVAPLDVHNLHAVYAGRIMLECLAISLTAPVMSEDEREALRGDLAEMRALAAERDLARWSAVHDRFHRRLVSGAPGAMATAMFNFYESGERYRRLSAMGDEPRGWREADVEHARIAAACSSGDGRAAAVELANHLARTALHLSAAFAPEVEPRPVRMALALVVGAPAELAGAVGRGRRSS